MPRIDMLLEYLIDDVSEAERTLMVQKTFDNLNL